MEASFAKTPDRISELSTLPFSFDLSGKRSSRRWHGHSAGVEMVCPTWEIGEEMTTLIALSHVDGFLVHRHAAWSPDNCHGAADIEDDAQAARSLKHQTALPRCDDIGRKTALTTNSHSYKVYKISMFWFLAGRCSA